MIKTKYCKECDKFEGDCDFFKGGHANENVNSFEEIKKQFDLKNRTTKIIPSKSRHNIQECELCTTNRFSESYYLNYCWVDLRK